MESSQTARQKDSTSEMEMSQSHPDKVSSKELQYLMQKSESEQKARPAKQRNNDTLKSYQYICGLYEDIIWAVNFGWESFVRRAGEGVGAAG